MSAQVPLSCSSFRCTCTRNWSGCVHKMATLLLLLHFSVKIQDQELGLLGPVSRAHGAYLQTTGTVNMISVTYQRIPDPAGSARIHCFGLDGTGYIPFSAPLLYATKQVDKSNCRLARRSNEQAVMQACHYLAKLITILLQIQQKAWQLAKL
jgi:hypothetical protein